MLPLAATVQNRGVRGCESHQLSMQHEKPPITGINDDISATSTELAPDPIDEDNLPAYTVLGDPILKVGLRETAIHLH